MPRKDSSNSNVDIINPGYRDLVRQFNSTGHKIVLAEFNNGFLDLDTDYFDSIHPNERGAAKLAAVWDEAIRSNGIRLAKRRQVHRPRSSSAVLAGRCQPCALSNSAVPVPP